MHRQFYRPLQAAILALAATSFLIIAPTATAAPLSTAQQADNRFDHRDYAEAADLYLHAADQASETDRSGLFVQAAESAMRAGRRDIALQALQKVQDAQLVPAQRMQANLLRVELGQIGDDPVEVLRRLPPPPADIDHDVAARIWSVRADAFLRFGDPIEGVRALVRRENLLRSSSDVRQNQTRIWQTLKATPAINAQFEHRDDLDNVTRGWLELALIDRTVWMEASSRDDALKKWQETYPDHPARREILSQLRESQPLLAARPKPPAPPPKPKAEAPTVITPTPIPVPSTPPGAAIQPAPAQTQPPVSRPAPGAAFSPVPPSTPGIALPALRNANSVALILPLSGALAMPAKAIRDGFLASYYELPEPRPRIQIYDSGSGAEETFAVYERAVDAGADMVVGPLAKESVATLARMSNPKNPILALNYLDAGDNAPDHFFQFGLSPEDEAQQVAERAVSDGRLKAVALIPEGDWGARTLTAFRDRLQSMGGSVLSVETFSGRPQDYAAAVSRLLKVAPAPADRPDKKATFQPRPGNDPDFVFIAAQPQQARQIRPQFRFVGAGNLPMYATSHVYEGFASASRDEDLNDIMFCDMPWVLSGGDIASQRERVRALWPDSYTRYPRLYAFGYDSARLLAVLNGKDSVSSYAAATGKLRIDAQGRIHRGLLWARFENGVPRLLPGSTGNP